MSVATDKSFIMTKRQCANVAVIGKKNNEKKHCVVSDENWPMHSFLFEVRFRAHCHFIKNTSVGLM